MEGLHLFFRELFTYSRHTNRQLIEVINAGSDKVPGVSVKLLSHILNAHHIWNQRILNQSAEYLVWQIHNGMELDPLDQVNFDTTLDALTKQELSATISYTNSKGQSYTNSIQDILFHIINHSTHHRAQIVSQLRQAGIEPPVTDYIFYKR